MQHFIDYKKFKTNICNKTGKKSIADSSYLKFKSDIKSIHGNVNSPQKYPPPIQNKMLKLGIFQNESELMKKN